MTDPNKSILKRIRTFIKRRNISRTEFGRRVGDPNLVFDMENKGREVRHKMRTKIQKVLADD